MAFVTNIRYELSEVWTQDNLGQKRFNVKQIFSRKLSLSLYFYRASDGVILPVVCNRGDTSSESGGENDETVYKKGHWKWIKKDGGMDWKWIDQ